MFDTVETNSGNCQIMFIVLQIGAWTVFLVLLAILLHLLS